MLLSRSEQEWQTESLAQLKKEAKGRGLSANGSKSKLIARLVNDDKTRQFSASTPAPAPTPTPAAAAPLPANPTPPPPPRGAVSDSTIIRARSMYTSQANAKFVGKRTTLDVKMPDFVEEPEASPRIPSVPDNYGSPSPTTPAPSASTPKVLTVASAATHPAGGPSHGLFTPTDAHYLEQKGSASTSGTTNFANISSGTPESAPGFWADLADELAIPTKWPAAKAAVESGEKEVKAMRERILSGVAPLKEAIGSPAAIEKNSEDGEKAETRDLQPEEKRGLWILLGLVVGGWAVGAAATPSNSDSSSHEST
ncbi:hypothetical protein BOTBODRAFT_35168 [Botryobasidium botryosum FD-172 SS1]|uniref:SAP domain-containing protein n=1 Tax=Botryobasidium botryosum (strain FD-172 SS1) TaxID=930990 RepID=A0A067M837_BOTB1|nr:hypothetical protein BOTBODRAFT_35168 [Botryobasidium botryosum FD-172 SS1]